MTLYTCKNYNKEKQQGFAMS